MKVFLSKSLQQAIAQASEGTYVLGTLNHEHQVATATGLVAGASGASLPGAAHSGSLVRHTLAVIGCDAGAAPFRIPRGATTTWTDKTGGKVDLEVYDTDQFFRRTPFAAEVLAHLRQERLLIVGLGSVGAPMGLELAMSGVGSLIALDKDELEIHNCMRHILGPAYIGWPKAVAFGEYVREHVPTCRCVPVHGNLFEGTRGDLRQLVEATQPTRILAATDSLRIQYLCQRLALHFQLPLMAVWCDNNAIEGEIFLWEPGQARAWRPGRPERGCYACLRDPDQVTITRSATFDYSSDDPDSYGGEPALGTFINRINNIAAIIMTAWMLRDCRSPTRLAGILDPYYDGKGLQYVRLGGPYRFEAAGQLTAKAPWAVEWYRVLKRTGCSFCDAGQGQQGILFPTELGDGVEAWERLEAVRSGSE